MGFFENIGRSVQATGRTTLQKSRELADITRLNSQRAENDKRINQLYLEIGRLYVELHGADPEPQMARQVQGITEMLSQNEMLNEQLQTLKGMAKCPHCGRFIPKNAVFCTSCGQRALAEDKTVCPGCGAVVTKGALFCTQCGTRIPDEAPAQEAAKARCTNCGAELEAGILFCTSCGQPVHQNPADAEAVQNTEAPVAQAEEEAK